LVRQANFSLAGYAKKSNEDDDDHVFQLGRVLRSWVLWGGKNRVAFNRAGSEGFAGDSREKWPRHGVKDRLKWDEL